MCGGTWPPFHGELKTRPDDQFLLDGTDNLIDAPTTFQPRPSERSSAILNSSTVTRGRPKCLPLAFAAASPHRTRSRISSLPHSAIEAKMPKTRLPFGTEVSPPSCRLSWRLPVTSAARCLNITRISGGKPSEPLWTLLQNGQNKASFSRLCTKMCTN